MVSKVELYNAMNTATPVYTIEQDKVVKLDINNENSDYDMNGMQYYFWYIDRTYNLVNLYLTKEAAEYALNKEKSND